MKKKDLYFIILFTLFGFFALQLPLIHIKGSRAAFTLFDFVAPIAGAFIGIVPGIISVLTVQIVNVLLKGGFTEPVAVMRLFPTLFAVAYFALYNRKQSLSKVILIVPLIAMLAFSLHPIGRTVWYYSLYWLIPVVAYFLRDRFAFTRALGATFTAHAVGGATWLYMFNLPAELWISLIPQVAIERFSMAIGISIAYVIFVNVLQVLIEKKVINLPFSIEKKYVFGFLR